MVTVLKGTKKNSLGENEMSIELKQDLKTVYSTADKLKEYL